MTKPFPYQKIGSKLIHTQFGGRCLLADEMGLGKTFQGLRYATKYVHLKGRPILAIVPAYLKYNWQNEAETHFGLSTIILDGRTPPPHADLDADLLIINYEILGGWVKLLKKLKCQVVLLDEIHYLQNPETLRTLYTMAVCKKIPFIVGMSGTPMTDSPINLYPILKLLQPKRVPSYRRYAKTYCNPTKTPWGWNLKGSSKKKKLGKILRRYFMIRRKVCDVLPELPPKRTEIVLLKMSKKQEYDKAERSFIKWLAEKDLPAAQRAIKVAHLVKSGYLRRLVAELKTKSIIQWLETMLREKEGKALVFGVHTEFLTTLQKHFAKQSHLITGSTTKAKRKEYEHDFKTNKKQRLIFGNVDAMGVGLNFTEAQYVVIAELPWQPHQVSQPIARAWRIGQEKNVLATILLAKGTIEEKVCKLLQQRQGTLNAILDDGKKYEKFDIYDQLKKELRV